MFRSHGLSRMPLIVMAMAAATLGCARAMQPAAPLAAAADAHALNTVFMANQTAIESARFVLTRASHPQVRELACQVLQRREVMQQRIEQLMSARGIHPQPEVAGPQGVQQVTQPRQMLQGRWGMSLDRRYLEHDRHSLRRLLETLEGSLVRSTSDPELREFLEAFRSELAEEVEAIERLQSSLSGWHA